MVKNIVIIGAGPSGLFCSIFATLQFPDISIEILEQRNILEEIGRLRQVIILKKSYEAIYELFKIKNFTNLMKKYIECVLYNKTKSSEFTVGPYECRSAKYINSNFDTDKKIIGVTITITNIQYLLLEYIKLYAPNIKITYNFKENLHEYVSSKYKPNEVIIIGCSGAGGSIRNTFKTDDLETFLEKYPKFKNAEYPIRNERRNFYIENNAGLEMDNYMLIVRYPVISKKNKKNDATGFGWTRKNKLAKAILITNYLKKNTLKNKFIDNKYKKLINTRDVFYRQLYYFTDLETFAQFGDCNFWTPCSIIDYAKKRFLVAKFIPKNTLNKKSIIHDYIISVGVNPSALIKTNTLAEPIAKKRDLYFRSPFYKNTIVVEPLKTTTKYSSVILQIVDYGTTRNPMMDFPPGMAIDLQLIDFSERPYIKYYPHIFSAKVISYNTIFIKKATMNDNFFPELYLQCFLDICDADVSKISQLINEGYTLSMNTQTPMHAKKIEEAIVKDMQSFNHKQQLDVNDIKKHAEIIRIWTAVRFARGIYNIKNGYFYCITGDEAVTVDPMTGRGVSNSILLCKNLIKLLSKEGALDIEYVKGTGIQAYEKYVYDLVYDVLKQGEDTKRKFLRMNFSFNYVMSITTLNVLNTNTIYNNYREVDSSLKKDACIKAETVYYEKYRRADIIDYFHTALQKEVVFLQEVSSDLLNAISVSVADTHCIYKSNYDEHAVYQLNDGPLKMQTKEDYILILLPKFFKKYFIIKDEQIPLASMNYGSLKMSPCIVLLSKNESYRSIIILVNLHLNRNNTKSDNRMVELFINDLMKKYNFDNKRDRIVIGGDFNTNKLNIPMLVKHGINMETHDGKETDYFLSNKNMDIIYENDKHLLDFSERAKYVAKKQDIPHDINAFTDHLIVKGSFLITH